MIASDRGKRTIDAIRSLLGTMEFDLAGCRFVELFGALGEPELGFALLCAADNTLTDEVGKGDVEFKRTQTIMPGGDHCDFRFALKKNGLV